MKKIIMVLAVFAFSVSYSFAQNANSGINVSKNGGEYILLDDCPNVYQATSSNYVTMANGFTKYTGVFDVSASCELPTKALVLNPAPGVTIVVTPSGMATLKIITKKI